MLSNRSIGFIVLSAVVFFGAAFVTLRAAERATQPGAQQPSRPAAMTQQTHPAPAAPEESATITDDPTTAPDPSQSADNNVSFPNDI